MSGLEILAVIAIVALVIVQQLRGQHLSGKRTVVLPLVLTAIGFSELHGSAGQLRPVDTVCLAIGAAGSLAIGLGFGAIMRLESRDGVLWARMPLRGLWLWAALVAWRVAVVVLASGLHAHVAASSSTLLFGLGLNRLAQAAVVVPRAMAARVPFAPEKDGRTFMAGAFQRDTTVPPSPRRSSRQQPTRDQHAIPSAVDAVRQLLGSADLGGRRR
ncbi:hypothetical protein [Kitasatospora sp. NBC_01266]|uniref:hypothetical protein n=1 Tax=Kitasatospora sp. NBC_01266 TaxID=2903572 RepID=UPI002E377FF3|nr:hypothetical protein [Kitasatospora sp. NBC_01266]